MAHKTYQERVECITLWCCSSHSEDDDVRDGLILKLLRLVHHKEHLVTKSSRGHHWIFRCMSWLGWVRFVVLCQDQYFDQKNHCWDHYFQIHGRCVSLKDDTCFQMMRSFGQKQRENCDWILYVLFGHRQFPKFHWWNRMHVVVEIVVAEH